MDYDKKLSGALFKNEKGDNPKRPDYKGSYTDGELKEFYVSAWIKISNAGKPFMSLKMEPKESGTGTAQTPKAMNQAPDNSFSASDSSGDTLPF